MPSGTPSKRAGCPIGKPSALLFRFLGRDAKPGGRTVFVCAGKAGDSAGTPVPGNRTALPSRNTCYGGSLLSVSCLDWVWLSITWRSSRLYAVRSSLSSCWATVCRYLSSVDTNASNTLCAVTWYGSSKREPNKPLRIPRTMAPSTAPPIPPIPTASCRDTT